MPIKAKLSCYTVVWLPKFLLLMASTHLNCFLHLWQKAKEIESKAQARVIDDAWKCVRDIQRGRGGLHLTKPKAVRNLNGDLCSTPAESL